MAARRPRADRRRRRVARGGGALRRRRGRLFVPALLGLGAPKWDYGARGTLLGVSRGSGRPQIVRAVLEGVAHRGADLVEVAEADGGVPIPALRVDGGMSDNPTFVQALADAAQRPVEVSPETEATTLGAAYLAGLATGVWADTDRAGRPLGAAGGRRAAARLLDRERWADALRRAERWFPDLSSWTSDPPDRRPPLVRKVTWPVTFRTRSSRGTASGRGGAAH